VLDCLVHSNYSKELTMPTQFFDRSYGLSHFKLNLSGPSGNVFYVTGAVERIVRKVEGYEASKHFAEMAMGTACNKLGFNNCHDYNTILRYCKEKTGITFVADSKLDGVDEDLYEVRESDGEVWL